MPDLKTAINIFHLENSLLEFDVGRHLPHYTCIRGFHRVNWDHSTCLKLITCIGMAISRYLLTYRDTAAYNLSRALHWQAIENRRRNARVACIANKTTAATDANHINRECHARLDIHLRMVSREILFPRRARMRDSFDGPALLMDRARLHFPDRCTDHRF